MQGKGSVLVDDISCRLEITKDGTTVADKPPIVNHKDGISVKADRGYRRTVREESSLHVEFSIRNMRATMLAAMKSRKSWRCWQEFDGWDEGARALFGGDGQRTRKIRPSSR